MRKAVDHAEHSEELEIHPLMSFLRAWYLEHIEGLDQQYGDWLNARGVY